MRAGAALLAGVGLVIVVGPSFMGPGPRVPVVGSPADVGLRYETVAFHPPDRPITLRAWWMPAEVVTHAQGYKLEPEEYVKRVTRFFDEGFVE